MDIGAQAGVNPGTIWAVSFAAIGFGTVYAWLINKASRADRLDGYTAIAVAVGVLGTMVLASFLIGIINMLLVLLTFFCTGVPMIGTDIWRYIQDREAREAALREVLARGNDDGDRA